MINTTKGRAHLPRCVCLTVILAIAWSSCAIGAAAEQASQAQPADKKIECAKNSWFGMLGEGPPCERELTRVQAGPYQPMAEANPDEVDQATYISVGNGVAYAPDLQQYANRVLDKLKARSGVTGIPTKVILLASGSPTAHATDAGNIYVPIKWFFRKDQGVGNPWLTSEDELAMMLGHELAHVLMKHPEPSFFGRVFKRLRSLLVVFSAASSLMDRSEGSAELAKLNQEEQQAYGKMQLLITINDKLTEPGWKRKEERAADRLGMDLIVAAGYNPLTALKWFDTLDAFEQENAKVEAARKQQVEAQLKVLMASGKLEEGLSKAMKDAGDGIMEVLTDEHGAAEERSKALEAYVDYHYPAQAAASGTRGSYTDALRRSAAILGAYSGLLSSTELIEKGQGDLAKAETKVAAAMNGPLASQALPSYLMYAIKKARKQGREARGVLDRGLGRANKPWKYYQSSFDLAMAEGRPDLARRAMEAGMRDLRSAPVLLPNLIKYAKELKDEAMVNKLVTLCAVKHVQYHDECVKAAK